MTNIKPPKLLKFTDHNGECLYLSSDLRFNSIEKSSRSGLTAIMMPNGRQYLVTDDVETVGSRFKVAGIPKGYLPRKGEYFTVNAPESGYRANMNCCLQCTYSDEFMIVFEGDQHKAVQTICVTQLAQDELRPLDADAVKALGGVKSHRG